MTIAMIWVLYELHAPWWCIASTLIMFVLKALYILAKEGKREDSDRTGSED